METASPTINAARKLTVFYGAISTWRSEVRETTTKHQPRATAFDF